MCSKNLFINEQHSNWLKQKQIKKRATLLVNIFETEHAAMESSQVNFINKI